MPADIGAARELIARCVSLRDQSRPEAVLRSELTSRLRQVFPDDSDRQWINHYSQGTEGATQILDGGGHLRTRFVDNLIRSTVIEYEPDLGVRQRYDHGLAQVREYVAGAVRSGIPIGQVRGILSDTVEWHVYDATMGVGIRPADCRVEDVEITEVDSFTANDSSEPTASRFVAFLKKHLAREQSRPLTSANLSDDLGLSSEHYAHSATTLQQIVLEARTRDSSAIVATDLWSRFVDYLESRPREFRIEHYVHEIYLALMARLLCANVLQQRGLLSDQDEITAIITGQWFEERFRLRSFVEQDYFGWLVGPGYLPQLLPIARDMQLDLFAYDYSVILDEDLFGRLITQLAERTQRRLLGQEWTPQWVARSLARKCVFNLPPGEVPRLLDMCCGSGAIIAEALKAVKESGRVENLADLFSSVMGFDIDPLAVMFAKTTWVVVLANEIRDSGEPVIVPIFHADSLFAVTPISSALPFPVEEGGIVIELDGSRIELPSILFSPSLYQLFDTIVDWCYDEARAATSRGSTESLTEGTTSTFMLGLLDGHGIRIDGGTKTQIFHSVFLLARKMAELAVSNRNGIWAFILRNTYRPGVLAGHFNGLVSNPPWLAMSQFARNPYRTQLSSRALAYGIAPSGASHLHLELATTHLLHAVDRYLDDNASIACLVPGTVFNGQHHSKLREQKYLGASRSVSFELREVWEIAPGTFKVRSAALIGAKRASVDQVRRELPSGAIASADRIEVVPLRLRRLGSRSAWTLGETTGSIAAAGTKVPLQGADLMPRSCVSVQIENRRGREWPVRTPRRGDPSYFGVTGAKKLRGKNFDGYVAPRFIHRMLQSLNLLPFVVDGHLIDVALPAQRLRDGSWRIMDADSIRGAGFVQTARRFERIDRGMAAGEVVKQLHEKIDERRKLSQQVFPRDGFLVVNGAGGGLACAAIVPLAGSNRIVIDQTLYWSLMNSEKEAYYVVGLMNSAAVSNAIRIFNPQGEFGPRHLHTLTNRIIPRYDRTNPTHQSVSRLAKKISSMAALIVRDDDRINKPAGAIASRRRLLRRQLAGTRDLVKLEELAQQVIVVS